MEGCRAHTAVLRDLDYKPVRMVVGQLCKLVESVVHKLVEHTDLGILARTVEGGHTYLAYKLVEGNTESTVEGNTENTVVGNTCSLGL